MTDEPTTPAEVWALIERADELVKYAPNRDATAAYAQARQILERARTAARAVQGAAPLERQVATRLNDLEKLEAGA